MSRLCRPPPFRPPLAGSSSKHLWGKEGGGRGEGIGWGYRCDGGGIPGRCGGVGASEVSAASGAGTTAGCPRCGWCMSRSVEARMMVLGATGTGVARRAF